MLRKILAVAIFLFAASQAVAAPRVDIYGPGQNVVNLGLAAPLTAPNAEARQMGATLQKLVSDNLSFLPFMRLTDPKTVLGGTVLAGVEPPAADFLPVTVAEPVPCRCAPLKPAAEQGFSARNTPM